MDLPSRPDSRGNQLRPRPRGRAPEFVVVIAGVCLALAGLWSCSDRPAEPVFDDVFDPAGEFGGDPFQVTAQANQAGVLVQWRRVAYQKPGDALKSYNVMRQLPGSDEYVLAGEVPQPAAGQSLAQFQDAGFVPARINTYKIRAVTELGRISSESAVASASVLAPAGVEFLDDAGKARSRYLRVRLRAAAHDTLRFGFTPDLADSSVVLPGGSLEALVDIDLGTAAANGETRTLYVGVRRPGELPPESADATEVAFDPRLSALDPHPVSNPFHVQLRTRGVELMRFALQRGDLDTSPWFDPTPTSGDTASVDTVAVDLAEGIIELQRVWVETLGDFGFTRLDSLNVTPTRVAPVCTTASLCFEIENGSPTTAKSVVGLSMHMLGATRMRLSELLPLDNVEWVAYADTLDFALSDGPGMKRIHAHFANDFDLGQAAADSILKLSQSVSRRVE